MLIADDGVVHRGAAEVDDRRGEPQHLLDRRRQQAVDVGHQSSPLVGLIEQHLHAGRQQVARRVAAGVHEQQEEPLELGVGQPVAIDLGLHERRGDVVAGVGPLVLGDLLRVAEHLA